MSYFLFLSAQNAIVPIMQATASQTYRPLLAPFWGQMTTPRLSASSEAASTPMSVSSCSSLTASDIAKRSPYSESVPTPCWES